MQLNTTETNRVNSKGNMAKFNASKQLCRVVARLHTDGVCLSCLMDSRILCTCTEGERDHADKKFWNECEQVLGLPRPNTPKGSKGLYK